MKSTNPPEIEIDVLELGQRVRKGRSSIAIGKEIKFSTNGLESYAFAKWSPIIYDAMVVAGSIEYSDRVLRRPSLGWARKFALRIPVNDPNHWNNPVLKQALQDAIEFLTGDYWFFEFVARTSTPDIPPQNNLPIPIDAKAILAYSDGMDSRSVAGIIGESLGSRLVRVRVGSKSRDCMRDKNKSKPFAKVPYTITYDKKSCESSARSRGFKFAMISAIAAYLADADEIIIPESGQGAIGPALIQVGHAYPDYRNHPLFMMRMEKFIDSLLGNSIHFEFPRIWSTKGDTLREFVSLPGERDWSSTRSCWQDSRWCSVNGSRRQCGICAACMLRRLSVHAAGLQEKCDIYICSNLNANTLDEAIDKDFKRTHVFREYAIAGILHLEHLARMADYDSKPLVDRHALMLAPALRISREESKCHLVRMLEKHALEWSNFMDSLGERSFIRDWAMAGK